MAGKLETLEERYDLELDRIVEEVGNMKGESVLLQFPEGLKQYACEVVDYLEEKNEGVEFFIWLGSCYGACDTPLNVDEDFDLLVQFGHAPWEDLE